MDIKAGCSAGWGWPSTEYFQLIFSSRRGGGLSQICFFFFSSQSAALHFQPTLPFLLRVVFMLWNWIALVSGRECSSPHRIH